MFKYFPYVLATTLSFIFLISGIIQHLNSAFFSDVGSWNFSLGAVFMCLAKMEKDSIKP